MGAPSDPTWTDSRIAQLKELFAKGQSASVIAAQFGVTRNAVIGKLTRLGIKRGHLSFTHAVTKAGISSPSVIAPRVRSAPKKAAFAPPAQPVVKVQAQVTKVEGPQPENTSASDAADKPVGGGVKLLDLSSSTCRWPIGNPTEEGFVFCGAPPVAGRPYCICHTSISYQPRSQTAARQKQAEKALKTRY